MRPLLIFPLIAAILACDGEPTVRDTSPGSQGNSPATPVTLAANKAVAEELDLADTRDFDDAIRGLVAAADPLIVRTQDGTVILDDKDYGFVAGDAPPSVNPSLWRQAKLNNINGLFEVSDGIYQLRGFDLSNMSIIEGERGWIVVDPLTTKETAAAALAFAREHLTPKPVTAVIITHSHIDHFGGVLSVLEADGSTEVFAPDGFMKEATSENVIAGTTMNRRAMFMYGQQLERSPRGHVDTGLGRSPVFGSPGITQPTRTIKTTGESITIDGLEFIFQNAAGSEAPAELTFYLPAKKAFCGAELVSRNMHNLYTLRGAKVRDAVKWSTYIDEAMTLFPDTQVYFASHHWPLWGNADIMDFLKKQRDGYRYIHDQTLRLASQGYTPGEIAESIEMPESLAQNFSNRGYYGTTKHNARAVYQNYFGWYDGNPAHLDPLPRSAAAVRYIDVMGGAEAVLLRAQADFAAGDYRWVAEVLNHLVFADPSNTTAKELLANTYDQLAYQAESGPWRDVYLTAALELRSGPPTESTGTSRAADLLREIPVEEFMAFISVMLNGPKAAGEDYIVNFTFTDINESHTLELENAVLHHRNGTPADNANVTVQITHDLFVRMLTGKAGIKETLFSDEVSVDGSVIDLLGFFTLLDPPNEVFPIVTP